MLRALGLGAAGLSLGGLELVAGCTAGGGAGPDTTVRPYDPKRPYWEQGNFAAVTTEETVTDLEVTGTIPPELSGLFVRNGSNPPTGTSLHWFLGDGMVHGVRLERGRASWYRNRYVRTPLAEAGKDLLSFGGPPGRANNQSNVSVVHHAGKLLTLGEVGWPFELATNDLSTVGPWDYTGSRRRSGARGTWCRRTSPSGGSAPRVRAWPSPRSGSATGPWTCLPTTGGTPAERSRHGWCTTTTPVDAPHGFELAGICHVDLRTGAETVWDPGDDLRGGEPVFVPGGDGEGEGWLLTYVWDRTTDRSALAVFDAGAVDDGPVGRVELPVRVPFGFHGLWVDEAAL